MTPGGAQKGQSTVEFALLLPLVVMCLALILSVVAATQAQLSVVNASRNAARVAIVFDDVAGDATSAATVAARDTTPVRQLHVELTTRDDFLTATVSAEWGIPFPMLGAWLPHVTLRASTTMLREATDSSS